ncbi:hypothetical protein PHLCEN_2v8841 [Hermanssonia centrifuga]|uniref:F-box domain-containing protein n=1 Tax=Hermanssonia centrifuga TaxID=98765 RepID=A0A2R6NSR0_9APHY|nr:hypothetical protein PHLCEN_2v8841 [Hermanssonia centrifuga]
MAPLPWNTLPTEMKFSVVDHLESADLRAFAKVNKEAYTIAVPAMWRIVDLQSDEALRSYLTNVPPSYHRYIHHLTITTKPTACGVEPTAQTTSDALTQLLRQCTQVEQLTLNLHTSLAKAVIPCFEALDALTVLSINHCGDEHQTPLSERLVVAIAASVPNLRELSLDRITRSALHAPELIGAYPFVPVVSGDEDIPPHPSLGSELSLPSLLRLPTLRKLRIRDTHLGDPKWSVTPICCSLEFLDLGSCYHETPDYNRVCTERIVGNVGHTVDEFSLNTAISADTYAFEKPKETPFKKLRKIHLTPLFPVDNVVDTLATLSGSPVEELSVRCHEDDVVDMCSALEDFLSLRVERGESAFYKDLAHINVVAVADIYDSPIPVSDNSFRTPGVSMPAEHVVAVKRLQEFCQDLRLTGHPTATSCPVDGVAATIVQKSIPV